MRSLLAQISDPHLRRGAGAEEAEAALGRAVRAMLALPDRPHAVLVSGDLTDSGDPHEYERVRALLAPLPMPVLPLAGNHDEAGAFEAALGAARWSVRVHGLRVVGCDTTQHGRPDGRLDTAWLEEQLGADPDTPTVVAMHHPPVATGLVIFDEIGLPEADRQALTDLVGRHPQVRRIVTGHVHRTAFSSVGGCGVVCCPSVGLAARLDLAAEDFDMRAEPPAFVLHALLPDGELVSHVQPVTG